MMIKINIAILAVVAFAACATGIENDFAWVDVDGFNNVGDPDGEPDGEPDDPEPVIYIFEVPNRNGDLNGRMGANDLCTLNRPEAFPGKSILAFASFDNGDEISLLADNEGIPTDLAIVAYESDMEIAPTWDSFLAGTWTNTMYDAGVLAPGVEFWTGSFTSGDYWPMAYCSGFDSTGGLGGVGTGDGGIGWLSVDAPSCNNPRSLLCLVY